MCINMYTYVYTLEIPMELWNIFLGKKNVRLHDGLVNNTTLRVNNNTSVKKDFTKQGT